MRVRPMFLPVIPCAQLAQSQNPLWCHGDFVCHILGKTLAWTTGQVVSELAPTRSGVLPQPHLMFLSMLPPRRSGAHGYGPCKGVAVERARRLHSGGSV